MTVVVVVCHACKKPHSFHDVVSFRAECDACSADLHACLACQRYDRYIENQCREDQADPVAVKDRRNLCESFRPRAPGEDNDAAANAAKEKLAALFAGNSFTSTSPAASPSDPQAEAKRKLEELFKKK